MDRRLGIITFLICLCLYMMPCCVQAASTSDATEMISMEEACDLTLTYQIDGTVYSDVSVKLYKIADVSEDFQYTLTVPFRDTGLTLNGIQSVGEWDIISATLESNILIHQITELFTEVTDTNGQVHFSSLEPGLYLAIPDIVSEEELHCSFESALLALPKLKEDGTWQYQVEAKSKGGKITPPEADEITYKVLKLWKGDQSTSSRPKDITVEIFRDGTSYQTVTLSEANQWSYSWTAKVDGAKWKVAERDVPAGYTVTVEEKGTAFVLTNTLQSQNSSTGIIKTGDTTNILLYMILLYASGAVLILLGLAGKRRRV